MPRTRPRTSYCGEVDPRRVLFVCTANICRSPTAELLARSRFGEDAVLFRSAGLLRGGKSMPKELEGLLGERKIETSSHRSNKMDQATLEAAELILTMEGRHVQEIAIAQPEAFAKTIPLRQAAALMASGGSLDGLLARMAERDASAYLSTEWDVDDPYKRGKRQYRKMVTKVDELIDQVISPISRAHQG